VGFRKRLEPRHEREQRHAFRRFLRPDAHVPGAEEPPDYFVKEVKQSRQMNFRELAAYIAELQQSGFDTVALQVQFYKKFSVPLFALILAMVSIPFAFLAGNRGANGGRRHEPGYLHAVLVHRTGVRAGGKFEPTARAGGGLVAGCRVLARGILLLARMRT